MFVRMCMYVYMYVYVHIYVCIYSCVYAGGNTENFFRRR